MNSEENNNESLEKDGKPISEISRKIIEDGENVKESVDELLRDSIKAGEVGIDRLTDITQEILEGVAEALSSVSADDRSERLEKAFAGLESAFNSTLHAASLSLKEAADKGEKFASEDLAKAVEEFKTIEKLFIETVIQIAKNSSSELGEQVKNFETHGKRVYENLKPSVQAVLEAAKDQPGQLAQVAVGAFASTLANALRTAGDLIDKKGK